MKINFLHKLYYVKILTLCINLQILMNFKKVKFKEIYVNFQGRRVNNEHCKEHNLHSNIKASILIF